MFCRARLGSKVVSSVAIIIFLSPKLRHDNVHSDKNRNDIQDTR
jgi:hypothetical protein